MVFVPHECASFCQYIVVNTVAKFRLYFDCSRTVKKETDKEQRNKEKS